MSQIVTKTGAASASAPAVRAEASPPACDIYESAGETVIVADLPGVEAKKVDLRFLDGVLKLDADRKPRGPAVDACLRSDYGTAGFARSFAVGQGVDPARISAELRNGVLTVHLPKAAVKPSRAVRVKIRG